MGVNEYIQIGERIKSLRKIRGIKQKDMADMLHLKNSTYSNYENGHREPPFEIILESARILKVAASDLMGNDWDKYDNILANEFAIPSETVEKNRKLLIGKIDNVVNHQIAIDTIADSIDIDLSNYELTENESTILDYLGRLNTTGQDEAIKRIEELTHIEKYTKED